MATFNQLKKELDKLKIQGYSIDRTLDKLVQKYEILADTAELYLLKEQSMERARHEEQ